MCHKYDLPVVSSAYGGGFDRCELSPLKRDVFAQMPPDKWKNVTFLDFFPPPPYSHLLTRPDELKSSPLEPLIAAMNKFPSNTMGIYQVLFQPVSASHDWHRNVQPYWISNMQVNFLAVCNFSQDMLNRLLLVI